MIFNLFKKKPATNNKQKDPTSLKSKSSFNRPRRKVDPKEATKFHGTKIQDKLMNELVGISFGIIADGKVDKSEAESLQKWLVSNKSVVDNPILNQLLRKIESFLEDGILDSKESIELFSILQKFAGADFQIGELRKSTKLPLDSPVPEIVFDGKKFCFTGTCSYGTRKDCELATIEKGGECQSRITNDTDYLVIGIYVSDAWISTSYGRKIERAMKIKENGGKIKIMGEEEWLKNIT